MKVYTYTDARQNFSRLLDDARQNGKVLIRRRDGSLFSLVPELQPDSPLDIEGVDTDISADEIVRTLRKERARSARKLTS